MSTTGNGASPGDPFGGGAVPPAQERAGRAAPRPSARDERRRLGERLAEAAEVEESGRVRGMPRTSPWQRSNAVWHRAGIDWSRAEPERRQPPAATVPAPRPATAYPAPVPPAPPQPGAPGPPPPGDAGPGEPEPWEPPRLRRRLPALPEIPPKPVAAAVVAVLVVAGGGYLLFGGGGDAKPAPAGPAAVAAGRMFALDPAVPAGSGRAHSLDAIAASGGTVVAIGAERGGVYSRGQFLTSADGGRTWKLATVRAANGGDPPQGEYPQLVAGGAGAWAALGATPAGLVQWTSRDARTWTRQPVSGAFRPGDKVNQLARTGSGFIAAGTATEKDATQAVIWTSADGVAWTRLGADRLAVPAGGTAVALSEVTAHGAAVVVHGRVSTTQTVKRKKKKVRRTVESEAFWQSPDAGRTWAPVTIPQSQGSSGDVVAVAATGAGFFAAREASRTTGKGKKKKTTAYGVVFASPDGRQWAPAGQIGVDGYSRIGLLRGADSGLTALLPIGGGKTTVMTSGDAKSWRRVGDLPAGRALTGAALTTQGPVVTGHLDSGDAYLTVAGGRDVNLAAVRGAVNPERTVDGIVADAGRTLAVGGSGGHAAIWTSPNGSAWTRARLPAPANDQRLLDAAHGPRGWLTAGTSGTGALVLTSADANTWQAMPGSKDLGTMAPAAVAASGSAYVVVGRDGTGAVVWTSADLRGWNRSGNAAKDDLDGSSDAPKWMSDVTAGPGGFVAVGGQTKNRTPQPALWTSPDGRNWALSTTPPALPHGTTEGSLTKVVAKGSVLVATGTAGPYAFASVSPDGGRSWQPVSLPGAAAGTSPTAVTVTPRGFVIAGTDGSDVLLWTSADGRTWRVSRPHGLGLDGPGVQRLDGMSAAGGTLLAVGFTGDYRGDEPTLWRRPAP